MIFCSASGLHGIISVEAGEDFSHSEEHLASSSIALDNGADAGGVPPQMEVLVLVCRAVGTDFAVSVV